MCPSEKAGAEPPAPAHDGGLAAGDDLLARAYEQRTVQLHEARLTLGETVEALVTELAQRRDETARLRDEVAALRDERDRALIEGRAQAERAQALDRALQIADEQVNGLRNLKLVRWSAGVRRLVYRYRARRR